MRGFFAKAASAAVTLSAALLVAGGQQQSGITQAPPQNNGPQIYSPYGRDADPTDETIRHAQEKKMIAARQNRIEADAEKICRLAEELNVSANTPEASTLPGKSAKKAEEVEKLARDLVERTKGQ